MAASAGRAVARRHYLLLSLFLFTVFCVPTFAANTPGQGWSQRYLGDNGSLFIKECGARTIDNCPVIRLLHKEPTEQFNFIYFDYIVADYVGRLEKLGHQNIEYDVEPGDSLNSITVNSSNNSIKFTTVILVSKDDIRYLEYSGSDPHFQAALPEFQRFLENEQAHGEKLDVSSSAINAK